MCTGLKVDYPGGAVLGRTMDVKSPVASNIVYQPQGYQVVQNLEGGYFPHRYKVLGVIFAQRDHLKDGVNEHGLVGITNEFYGSNLYDDEVVPGQTNITSYHFLTYVLSNFKSIEEIIEYLDTIHFSQHTSEGEGVINPMFHYMFTDSSQRCIVVEPQEGGGLEWRDNPYNAITNSPELAKHEKRLKKLMDLDDLDDFNSSKKLPGGYDPISRFIKTFYMAQTALPSSDSDQAFSTFYSVMAALTLPRGFIKNKEFNSQTFTSYIAAYDTRSRRLTVKTANNPLVYELKLDDIEQIDHRQEFFIDDQFKTVEIDQLEK